MHFFIKILNVFLEPLRSFTIIYKITCLSKWLVDFCYKASKKASHPKIIYRKLIPAQILALSQTLFCKISEEAWEMLLH